MVRTAVLGFPRIGPDRELKRALEGFWRGERSAEELRETGRELRAEHLRRAAEHGVEVVPTGDFSFYDHVLDTAVMVGAVPSRFVTGDPSDGGPAGLETYFAMARGTQQAKPLEMTKWFDTNYHYLVPELDASTTFSLHPEGQLTQLSEAQQLAGRLDGQLQPRPVVLGPVSFLLLSRARGVDALELLDPLLDVYVELLDELAAAGADEVQVDEPCLVQPRSEQELQAFERAWSRLSEREAPRLVLATYFEGLDVGDNLTRTLQLPADGFHLDLTRAPEQLDAALEVLSGREHATLSLGVIDGRNVWVADLDRARDQARQAADALSEDRLTLATSCSLLHVPYRAAEETGIDPAVREWLAFADEKLAELGTLSRALEADDGPERDRLLAANREARQRRSESAKVADPAVRRRMDELDDEHYRRAADFGQRRAAQAERLGLPELPTTTVGSYPQTGEIRRKRAAHRRDELSREDYEAFLEQQIREVVAFQEEVGLDVLVHGEPERNDMVAYFAERLEGFVLPRSGWVQSYGSRCVRPPILYGDVSRPEPITVRWWRYAQSLTDKPVKGMLTGPVTILQWSFVRDDQPRAETCQQVALAIRDEVVDLDAAGAPVIQIDEAAFREGVPLHPGDRAEYLQWAVDCFRLAAAGTSEATQLHAHMCYSDFNDIIDDVARLDADVLLIEASRSDMQLLEAFRDFDYPNGIGPGVYDIHSPRVPTVEEMEKLLGKATEYLDRDQLWVTPDCGLKTRSWEDVHHALENLVEAAHRRRPAVAAR